MHTCGLTQAGWERKEWVMAYRPARMPGFRERLRRQKEGRIGEDHLEIRKGYTAWGRGLILLRMTAVRNEAGKYLTLTDGGISVRF